MSVGSLVVREMFPIRHSHYFTIKVDMIPDIEVHNVLQETRTFGGLESGMLRTRETGFNENPQETNEKLDEHVRTSQL